MRVMIAIEYMPSVSAGRMMWIARVLERRRSCLRGAASIM